MPAADFSPGRQDVVYRTGDTRTVEVDWPLDLTGRTPVCVLLSTVTGELIDTLTSQVTDASAGKINVTFPATLVVGTYVWAMRLDDDTTGIRGYVEVTP
jgi:hypothetical protein